MCAGFTPDTHDAPCRRRASEFKTKPKGPRTVSQRREWYNLGVHPVRPITRRQGTNLGHNDGITTARNESLPPVHNKPMNSPLEGKSAGC